MFLSSSTLDELLPLNHHLHHPRRGLLHATASASEGSFTPRASQEWHVCQEIWCQYLPRALQSGCPPSFIPHHPHAPVWRRCCCKDLKQVCCFPTFISFSQKEELQLTYILHLLNPQHLTQSSLSMKYTAWGRKNVKKRN